MSFTDSELKKAINTIYTVNIEFKKGSQDELINAEKYALSIHNAYGEITIFEGNPACFPYVHITGYEKETCFYMANMVIRALKKDECYSFKL